MSPDLPPTTSTTTTLTPSQNNISIWKRISLFFNSNRYDPSQGLHHNDAAKIKHWSDNLLKIGIGSVLVTITANLYLLYLANIRLIHFKSIQKDIITNQNQRIEINNAVNFLQSQTLAIEAIKSALPDETRFVNFIETLESIAGATSANNSIKISATAPTKNGNYQFIPFTIELVTDISNFTNFLKQMEKLPYFIEVTNIQIKSEGVPKNLWDITLNARIYVQSPFSKQPIISQLKF